MKIYTTYAVKIREAHGALTDTVTQYRRAVAFFLEAVLGEWDELREITAPLERQRAIETLTHRTRKNPQPKYDFDQRFRKFPSYLRRAAITDAVTKTLAYQSRLEEWEKEQAKLKAEGGRGRIPFPGRPAVGFSFPVMYRGNCYIRTGDYSASLKVYAGDQKWDWLDVEFRKTDVDYILHHCGDRKECAPTLRKRGKNWYLDFSFEEKVELRDKPVGEQVVAAVDLGIRTDCACCIMRADGSILGRKLLSLTAERDQLKHSLNRIRKARQNGAGRMPRLWAKVKGLSEDIARKTAQFIADTAEHYHADVIVLPYLDLNGKKTGLRKQEVHHWKLSSIQQILTGKAHRMGMKIRRTCAHNASLLAFDGSGKVKRKAGSRSICIFSTGKEYHGDLSASYNLAARYFIREILGTLPEKERKEAEEKVPEIRRRSECTLATLRSLREALEPG